MTLTIYDAPRSPTLVRLVMGFDGISCKATSQWLFEHDLTRTRLRNRHVVWAKSRPGHGVAYPRVL